jgi:hypothetical protein
MMNDDKQTTESFSAQEGLQELDEQALEGVTGAGSFTGFVKNLFKGCIACGAPKPASEPSGSNGKVPTIHETFTPSQAMNPQQVQANLARNQSVHVMPGTDGFNTAINMNETMRQQRFRGPR